MEALTKPCSSIDDLLHDQAAALRQWFASGGRKIEDLIIRKFPSWLEPEQFLDAGIEEPFATARFRLMMRNKDNLWRVAIEMVFHDEPWTLEDGTTAESGILFYVLDDKDQRVAVDYFAVSLFPAGLSVTPEQWCLYWFRKLAKSHHINCIFAHKVFEVELD